MKLKRSCKLILQFFREGNFLNLRIIEYLQLGTGLAFSPG